MSTKLRRAQRSAIAPQPSRRAMVGRVEEFDQLAFLRNRLRDMAEERGDWSGCPMPLEGQRLVIEPTFKYKGLGDMDSGEGEEQKDAEPGFKVRNIFWSSRRHARFAICEDPDGKVWGAPLAGSATGARALLNTLGASDAWGIEQESNATQLLGSMLRHRQFRQYLLTGSFLERSERSGVTYMFRRLRPTVAMSSSSDVMRILCTMCMHPIGYYEESWAGCMCPTDDVIAHLAMMRGDEHMFWRRCNQHAPCDPSGGLV